MVVRLIPLTVLHSVAFPTISFMAVSEVMGRVCVCMCLPFCMSNLSWLTIQGGYQRSIFQARALKFLAQFRLLVCIYAAACLL